MLQALRRVFDPRARLRETLGRQELPAFTANQLGVLKALRDPDSSLADIGRLLAPDPGLSVKVLKTVNSAAFGLRRAVSDPTHAVTLLGRAELENLVIGVSTCQALPRQRAQGFDPRGFWRTSSRRAATARLLADRVSPRDRGLCFTAGLLQDMAIPLLATARTEAYGPLLEQTRGSAALFGLERERLGFDHAEVASWLCAAWSFPQVLTDAILGHHTADAEAPVAVQVVAVMDHGNNHAAVVDHAADSLDLRSDEVVALLRQGAEQGDAMARLLLS